MKTPIFLLGIFLLIISCNSAAKISLLKDNNDAVFANHVSYDASRRGSLIFKNEKDKIVVISEPPPDVATKLATDLGAKVNVQDAVETEAYLSTSKAIAELGKRTAAVNMLRDALYKMSEMNLSGTLDSTAERLFAKILTSVESMHKVEMEQAIKETQEAVAKVAEAEAKVAEAKNNQILAQNSFEGNEILGAKKNYQIAVDLLLEQDLDKAKLYFKALYKKYPIHFNIDEINTLLQKYEGRNPTADDWKEIYKALKSNTWGMEKETIKKLNSK